MSKDFANSYEQHSWEFALSEHSRMHDWIERFGKSETYASQLLVRRANERIAELEERFPQLKKKM